MMSKKNYNPNLFTYFLSRMLFLGGGLSLILNISNKDTYISSILGTLIGIIVIYLINKIKSDNYNKLFKLIYIIYLIFITFIILIILSTFIYSYFLPYTPSFLSCLPIIALSILLTSKDKRIIYYIAFILFFLSIFTISLKSSLLVNEFKLSNIFPILSHSSSDIFKSVFFYVVLSTSPYLILINEDTNFKDSIKYYLTANISNILIILTITFILGEMVNVYSYPEYAILRKIRFFDFLENIENFLTAVWFIDIYITLSLIGNSFKNTINSKTTIIPFIISIIILFLVDKYISNNFLISILIYQIFTYILFGLILIIIIILIISKIIRKEQQTSSEV